MFDGLTMVSYDGHNRNKMMVDHVWTMVDHGRPWSGGQMFAGATILKFDQHHVKIHVHIFSKYRLMKSVGQGLEESSGLCKVPIQSQGNFCFQDFLNKKAKNPFFFLQKFIRAKSSFDLNTFRNTSLKLGIKLKN